MTAAGSSKFGEKGGGNLGAGRQRLVAAHFAPCTEKFPVGAIGAQSRAGQGACDEIVHAGLIVDSEIGQPRLHGTILDQGQTLLVHPIIRRAAFDHRGRDPALGCFSITMHIFHPSLLFWLPGCNDPPS
jgi:hypothetical protein